MMRKTTMAKTWRRRMPLIVKMLPNLNSHRNQKLQGNCKVSGRVVLADDLHYKSIIPRTKWN